MDKLRAAAAGVAEWAARSRPMMWLLGVISPKSGGDEAQRGQGLAEYALILAGVAVAAIVSLAVVGNSINGLFLDPISSEFSRVLSIIGL